MDGTSLLTATLAQIVGIPIRGLDVRSFEASEEVREHRTHKVSVVVAVIILELKENRICLSRKKRKFT